MVDKLVIVFLFFVGCICCDITAGNVSPTLAIVTGRAATKDYFPRAQAIFRLGTRLQPADIDAIYDFLNSKQADNLKILEFNSLKNDLVIVLMRQERYPAKLSAALLFMYRDKEHHPVWRDYCVQFMGRFYPQATLSDRKLLEQGMREALNESSSGIAGTALIAVNSNLVLCEIPKQYLLDQAYMLVQSENSKEFVKLTALQIGALNGDKRILPIARQILKNKHSIPLQSSALAVLGFLGGENDQETLTHFSCSSDIRLRAAAQGAQKRISDRKSHNNH